MLIRIIGAGLAGSEAAWQLAQREDLKIQLWEMRPKFRTAAHHTNNFAELVCSNSLGSEFLTTARGLLIREMENFDSLIIRAARLAKVPAGQALAVDREIFGQYITETLSQKSNIEIIRDEFVDNLDDGIPTIIASGPLSSEQLVKQIQQLLTKANPEAGSNCLHFFDAAAPIITAESIDMNIAFRASRYNKGDSADYINCPFYNLEEFENFYQALINAQTIELKDFEKKNLRYFEACMPLEALAKRGFKTLCFGPLKPVGLRDPRYPDLKAFAVVQLRQDNVIGSLFNMVGFQTNLKWSEQKRIFALIPGLANLDIVRYGVMHQNIFINSPLFLNTQLQLKNFSNIYFAGQITGVEGYTESAASGIVAAQSFISGKIFPRTTMIGALMHYISHCDPSRFQPINSNWGLLNFDLQEKNKNLKNQIFVQRSLQALQDEFKLKECQKNFV